PGAAVRPDLVAKDPGTLHFDIDAGALGADGAAYFVNREVESASLSKDDLNFAWYAIGPDLAKLRQYTTLSSDVVEMPDHPLIFGRPATIERFPTGLLGHDAAYRISWQPVDGLWAVIAVNDPDQSRVVKAAKALKLNVSQRCVAPMHLASLP